MKKLLIVLMVLAVSSFLFVGCIPTAPVVVEEPVVPVVTAPGAIIDIAAIPGVTAPVADAVPDLKVTATAQYTGVITWSPTVVGTFAAGTVYTATITLTAKTGYTLTGVLANFFTVAGAASDTNPANSGVVTAVYAKTTAVAIIDLGGFLNPIDGVTAPVTGAVPDLTVDATVQYTGKTTWSPAVVGTFAAGTVYTATITLTPKAGYTLTGVLANFFEVLGIGTGTDTNPANSGVVTAIFDATLTPPTVKWSTTGDRNGDADVAGETLVLTFSIAMTPIDVSTPGLIKAALAATDAAGVARVGGADATAVWNATNTVLTVTFNAAVSDIVATDIITADTAVLTGFISAAGVPLTTVNPYKVKATDF